MKPVDLLLLNGKVFTFDSKNSQASAIAIKDGKFLEIGSDSNLSLLKKKSERVIDLKGKTVLPGLTDTHTHLMDTGLNMLGADVTHAKTISEIQNIFRQYAKTVPTDQWILGHGFDDSTILEKRFVLMHELDAASKTQPVCLFRRDLHSCMVNQAGWKTVNLDPTTVGIELDEKGTPNGVLVETAYYRTSDFIFSQISDAMRLRGLQTACQYAVEHGLTEIHCLEGGGKIADMNVSVLRANQDNIPVRTVIYHQTTNVSLVKSEQAKCIGGCILIDGSIGSRTAAVTVPFQDDPLDKHNCGMLFFKDDELYEFVEESHRNNLQVSMHAIGDRAIGQLLNTYEKVLKKYPKKDHRHRLEHFELCTMEQIKKTSELGVVLAMQPAFDYLWGGANQLYHSRLGLERSLFSNPFRTILDHGCIVSGGSDSDVTPLDPILGIHSAVNHFNPQQRITVDEAIRMYTTHAAFAAFEENQRGSIEPNKLADLTILEENPFSIDKNRIKDIPVAMTICRGKVVYERN
jgi:predicted amidohydrolase YtcJ